MALDGGTQISSVYGFLNKSDCIESGFNDAGAVQDVFSINKLGERVCGIALGSSIAVTVASFLLPVFVQPVCGFQDMSSAS